MAFCERPHRTLTICWPSPPRSIFSGVQHGFDIVEEAHAEGWDVLLDVSAFAPTNRFDVASVVRDSHYLRRDEGAFEDGTVDYLNLPAVTIGLRHVDRVGLDSIHRRVGCLTGWLLDALDGLRRHNGRGWCRFTDLAPSEIAAERWPSLCRIVTVSQSTTCG